MILLMQKLVERNPFKLFRRVGIRSLGDQNIERVLRVLVFILQGVLFVSGHSETRDVVINFWLGLSQGFQA